MPECPISVGRTVLYRLSSTEIRPAIVTRVLLNERVNLQVFLDGPNDTEWCDGICETVWHGTVAKGDGVGEWSWPPRVEPKAV